MGAISHIIVHHTASPVSWTVERIRKMHIEERGWRDVGYHYLIRLQGFETAKAFIGRPHDGSDHLDSWEYGAHVKGSNRTSLGVALIGDFSINPKVPNAMFAELVELLADLCAVHALVPDDAIRGHNEMPNTSTACPAIDMSVVRKAVTQQMNINKQEVCTCDCHSTT